MNTNKVEVIGIRLIGVYFIVLALSAMPNVMVTYEVASSDDFRHPEWMIASSVASIIITGLLGMLMAFKANMIAILIGRSESGVKELERRAVMPSVVQILGLYFMASSLGDIAEGVITAVTVESSYSLYISMIVPGCIELAVGGFLVHQSHTVSNYLASVRECV